MEQGESTVPYQAITARGDVHVEDDIGDLEIPRIRNRRVRDTRKATLQRICSRICQSLSQFVSKKKGYCKH